MAVCTGKFELNTLRFQIRRNKKFAVSKISGYEDTYVCMEPWLDRELTHLYEQSSIATKLRREQAFLYDYLIRAVRF